MCSSDLVERQHFAHHGRMVPVEALGLVAAERVLQHVDEAAVAEGAELLRGLSRGDLEEEARTVARDPPHASVRSLMPDERNCVKR